MKLWELPGSTEAGQENAAQKALLFAVMRQYAPILEFAEFYQIVGNSDTPRKASSATGGTNRAIDDNFPDNKVAQDYSTVSLAIFGDKIQIDQAHVRRGTDIASLRITELTSFGKNWAKNFQYQLFNGTGTTNQPNGFLTLATAAAQSSSLSDTINTDAKRKVLINKIREKMLEIPGGAQFICMPSGILSELSSLAMEYVKYGPTQFGGWIPTINGVPVIPAGTDATNNQTLPFSSTAAGKVVIGRFGEKSDLTIATSVGVEIKDLGLVGPHWTTSVELDIDCAILDTNSIRIIDTITYA